MSVSLIASMAPTGLLLSCAGFLNGSTGLISRRLFLSISLFNEIMSGSANF